MLNLLKSKTLEKVSIACFIFVISLSMVSCSSNIPSQSSQEIKSWNNINHYHSRYVKQMNHQNVSYQINQANQSESSYVKKVNEQSMPAKARSDYSTSIEEKNKAGIKPPIEPDLPQEED